jgi:hypothetical protein
LTRSSAAISFRSFLYCLYPTGVPLRPAHDIMGWQAKQVF